MFHSDHSRSISANLSKFLLSALVASSTLAVFPAVSLGEIIRGPGINTSFSGANLPSYRYDDYDFEKYQSLYNQSQQSFNWAQNAFNSADQSLRMAQSRENDLSNNLNTQARALEVNRRKQSDLSKTIADSQANLQRMQQALPQAQDQAAALQKQVVSTATIIEDLKNRLAQAQTEDQKKALQAQIDTQSQILQQLQQNLSVKGTEVVNLTSQIQQTQSTLASATSQLATAKSEDQQLQGRIAEIQSALQSAHNDSLNRAAERERANAELQNRARDLEVTRRNVEQVRANIDAAMRILATNGNNDGANDGNREGYELGQARGSSDGNARGNSDGNSRGTADGQARDYNAGYASGVQQSTRDANQKSNNDAQVAGQADGKRQGQTDGLKAAYDLGMREGLAHGAATGDDTEAYAQGRASGESAGLADAVKDAQYREGEGYNDKENEFLKAPLKSVVIGDQAMADKFKGLQGRYSNEGDDRYYRPQPGILPHPRLEQSYRDAYDNAYRTNLSASYRSNYDSSYKSSYDSSYRTSYNQAYAQVYPNSQKDGYNQGYKDNYQKAYDVNYKAVYAQVYKDNYQSTFDQFKLDPTQRASGFKDGNRIASKQKGYNEGHKAAYDANLQGEKDKAYAHGIVRANDLYTNNPVVQVTSLELREVDADGIYRPGEGLAVVMKLKNFGLKPKTDLQSSLENAQGAISIAQARVQTASIPEQSDAIVIVPVQASVAASANDGANLQVVLKALSGQKNYLSQAVNLTAQYPAKVQITNFDGILLPGVETKVKLAVKNRSKSVQNLNLAVLVDANKVVAPAQLSVASLAAGQTQEITLSLTGKVEARFEETGLELRTAQAGSQWAMSESMKMTIIGRHQANAQAKGMILSSNMASASGKKLYGSDVLDTWDFRVDGALSDLGTLDPYKGKVLHILADEYSQVDAATVQTLKKFISNNGSVIMWGGRLDRSPMAQALAGVLGVQIAAAQNLNGAVSGTDKLTGLSTNVRGVVSVLSSGSQKSTQVLASNVGNIGVMMFGDSSQESVGQALALGLDLADLETAQVQQIVQAFANVRTSFESKLTQAMKSPASVMNLIVQDIVNEMIGAELSGTGRYYKDKEDSNKLARALKKFIGEAGRKSSQAAELTKYYPLIVDTINGKLKGEMWRAQSVLDKRYGSFFTARNLKDLYCEGHSNDQRCQDNNLNR